MMMQTTLINTVVACCVGAGSLLAGAGGYDVAKNVFLKPEPYGLQAAELKYEDGKFIQRIVPINAPRVPAQWTAEINRNGSQICGGSGFANYEGVEQIYSPNDWTGDNCPELKTGDFAIATWKYQDVNDNNIIVTREVVIK